MAQLSTNLPWELANDRWSSILNPIIAVPMLSGIQIDGIRLVATTPKTINHLLQRKPQGWFLLDINASATVWRTKDFNDLTITLESSADATISIWVF